MRKNAFLTISPVLLVGIFLLVGCGSLTRISEEDNSGPWLSFEQVAHDFTVIKPGKTSVLQLEKFGFGRNSSSITEIDYFKIPSYLFGGDSTASRDSLPESIRDCIGLKNRCYALIVKAKYLSHVGKESIITRVFQKKRITQTNGWSFEAIIVMLDDIVVYAQPREQQPNISVRKQKKDPKGFLDGIFRPLSLLF